MYIPRSTAGKTAQQLWAMRNKDKVNELARRGRDRSRERNPYLQWARDVYNSAKCRSTKLEIKFELTLDIILSKIVTHCPAFGIELCYQNNVVSDNSPTLDRLIPSNGYVEDNISVLSMKANRIKNNATIEDLEMLVNYMKYKLGV